MLRISIALKLLMILTCLNFTSASAYASDDDYLRATDDPENVKHKLFTKRKKIELNLPDLGLILNQSFITTYLIHGGVTYFSSEEWGFGVEASMGLNQNKGERECVENFYNDFRDHLTKECGDDPEVGQSDPEYGVKSNYGPAYMPIREIRYILAANMVWNPVYGKQILFLSATNYFDVFLTMGGGIVMSDYYAESTKLRDGSTSRANIENGKPNGGADPSRTDLYGENGRPDVQQQTHPFINLGIGQKFHFMKRFSVKFEFRNMTLLGTPSGFENLFAIWGGFGMRF